MGHTIYYETVISKWEEFMRFIERVCMGLGYGIEIQENAVLIFPSCEAVEPLRVERKGEGFAKTNLIEPCHSVYLLMLYSVSSFGSVSVWED